MLEKPFYTPGQSDNNPRQSPTEFSPAKPAGSDPVSPMPLPEGSEVERHAQTMAFDPVSGQFKPVEWIAGKMRVDAVLDASGITIGAVKVQDSAGTSELAVDADGSARVTVVDKFNGRPIQTTITRGANGLVQQVVESDGFNTKTTTISRNADQTVASIAEAIV